MGSFIFCTSFFDNESEYRKRYLRWIDYYSSLEFSKDKPSKHPTQKPVALLEYLIKTYTNENDIVLDFTMGSGSTGVAAKNLNREFIGIELDPSYFKIAENRINGWFFRSRFFTGSISKY